MLKTRFVRGNIDTSFISKILRGGYKKRANTQKKSKTLTVQRSRHNWFCTQMRASLGGKETYLRRKRCSRASCAATRPSFYTCTCCNVSFSWSSFVSRDDFDAHEVKETRSFFRLSFSQRFRLCSTKLFPKKRFFLRARTSFWCARVCSRRTQSDRDLLLLFVCALYTARSTKVVQVNKEYVRSCVGLLNGMIKIKGTE